MATRLARSKKEIAMIRFTIHSAQTAPADSRPLLDAVGKSLGFVPNLYGVFAESPAALRGALAIYEAFSGSTLSAVEQQLVMLAVSEANECRYCVAAHSTIAKRFVKVDPKLVDATRRGVPLRDAKLDALVTFTRKVVDLRGHLSEAEVADFLAAGYNKAHAMEVLLGVGMKTFNNYVDHIAHTPLNGEFEAEAWLPSRKTA
jgi:uncharacterized peroxidase-related enzyme